MGRGAAGAEGGLGRGCPLPIGVRPGEAKNLSFWLKIVHFGIYSDKNSIEKHHRIARQQ